MPKLSVIINPIAGTKDKAQIPDLVRKTLAQHWDVEILHTQHRGHATELAHQAAQRGVKAVLAVGGDGTVNETATGLVGTDTALAILPMGSGNGLARHLQIPMGQLAAIEHLKTAVVRTIDSCQMNGQAFFCTAGMGFDAHIAYLFAQQHTRGLSTYVRTTLNEFFSYKPQRYRLHFDNQTQVREAFLITFANANQFGNNAFIAPLADIQDGKMDVCVMSQFPVYQAAGIGLRMFAKTIHRSNFMETWKTGGVVIEREQEGSVHLDGEPVQMGKTLTLTIKPQSLRVLVAPNASLV